MQVKHTSLHRDSVSLLPQFGQVVISLDTSLGGMVRSKSNGGFVMKLVLAVLLLLSTTVAVAGELPEAPTPQPPPTRFWDRQQVVGFAASTGMRAWDAAYTCHLAQSPGWHEDWLPTQSCAGVVGLLAAGEVGVVGLQYLFYRTGHRKLQRIVPWVSVAVSAAAISRSYANQHH